jgi:hypothetical protein
VDCFDTEDEGPAVSQNARTFHPLGNLFMTNSDINNYSQDSAVSIGARLQAGQPGVFLGGPTQPGVHPASPMGAGGFFPVKKAAKAPSCQNCPPSSAKFKNVWSSISFSPYAFHGIVLIKYIDQFTLLLEATERLFSTWFNN